MHLVEVNLDDVPDLTLPERLLSIATALQVAAPTSTSMSAPRREETEFLGRSIAFRRLLIEV